MIYTLLAGVALGSSLGGDSALQPPRGWNSYDSYTWKVSEEEFLANCKAMANKLSSSGYEYCVVDYLWFQELDSTTADGNRTANAAKDAPPPAASGRSDTREEYREKSAPLHDPITKLYIDSNGRLLPAPDRWPVHAMGMKFGIHIMRGISIAAIAAKSPVLGFPSVTAADIANASSSSLCPWWKGVKSVNLSHPAGQAFYDSIYTQYSDWGVDFIKNDCVFGNQFVPDQIHAQAKSIRAVAAKTGKAAIVYSLSPGGGFAEDTLHIQDLAPLINKDVNMYRVTGDDWDTWDAVASHFGVAARAAAASLIGAPGLEGKSWPDLDMLPFGFITSPVLDPFTLSLLSNPSVLAINSFSTGNRQVSMKNASIVWTATIASSGSSSAAGAVAHAGVYVALFNTDTTSSHKVSVALDAVGLKGFSGKVLNVWSGKNEDHPSPISNGILSANVEPTSVVLLRLT
eukprot:gene1534-18271_t